MPHTSLRRARSRGAAFLFPSIGVSAAPEARKPLASSETPPGFEHLDLVAKTKPLHTYKLYPLKTHVGFQQEKRARGRGLVASLVIAPHYLQSHSPSY